MVKLSQKHGQSSNVLIAMAIHFMIDYCLDTPNDVIKLLLILNKYQTYFKSLIDINFVSKDLSDNDPNVHSWINMLNTKDAKDKPTMSISVNQALLISSHVLKLTFKQAYGFMLKQNGGAKSDVQTYMKEKYEELLKLSSSKKLAGHKFVKFLGQLSNSLKRNLIETLDEEKQKSLLQQIHAV